MSQRSGSGSTLLRALLHARRLEARWLVLVFVAAAFIPLSQDDYFALIATRVLIYWILVSGLTLVVGYAGQLAIGYVGLFTIGAYTASVLAAGTIMPWAGVIPALGAAVLAGAVAGCIVGLPALRLSTFYFAMATLGFAGIVSQMVVRWTWLTGGSIGVTGPSFPSLFSTAWGFYSLCWCLAAVSTLLIFKLCNSGFGRSLLALRDMEVAAEAAGIGRVRLFLLAFIVSGSLAGLAGGLFASLQTYITPDAFTTELSLLFFIAVLIGGQTSVLGPLVGTIVLTLLPEFAAPLVKWSAFLYSFLLLAIVLVLPGGLAEVFAPKRGRKRPVGSLHQSARDSAPAAAQTRAGPNLILTNLSLHFGGLRAIDNLSLEVRPGSIHGLIGPNGSGKTTTLNVVSGFYKPTAGSVRLGTSSIEKEPVRARARRRIARTFQTPRVVGDVSVIENVMMGADSWSKISFWGLLLNSRKSRDNEAASVWKALEALHTVGLEGLAGAPAMQLEHTELRFLEIARALIMQPTILLLDEPAAGLTPTEIEHLSKVIRAIRDRGTGVLLVEHHTELVFSICDRITVLHLGRLLAEGTPEEVRRHEEVRDVYLGQ